MSGPHPTISAWQRDEHHGHYLATMHDWTLTVVWTPNSSKARGSFNWHAEHSDGEKQHGHHPFEEMSDAMADAEAFARKQARLRDWKIAQMAEASADH